MHIYISVLRKTMCIKLFDMSIKTYDALYGILYTVEWEMIYIVYTLSHTFHIKSL